MSIFGAGPQFWEGIAGFTRKMLSPYLRKMPASVQSVQGTAPSQTAVVARADELAALAAGEINEIARPAYPVWGSVVVGQQVWCLVDGAGLHVMGTPDAHNHAKPKDHILGANHVWDSATGYHVKPGEAMVNGALLSWSTNISVAGLVLTANTLYHIYLFNNAGTPAIETSTVAPSAPYFGTARSKSGDVSRRYIGSMRTDGLATVSLIRWLVQGNLYMYQPETENLPQLLNNGLATTYTSVSLAGWVPPTTRIAQIRVLNFSTGGFVSLKNSEHGFAITSVPPKNFAIMPMPTDGLQGIQYYFDIAQTSGFYVSVFGYQVAR